MFVACRMISQPLCVLARPTLRGNPLLVRAGLADLACRDAESAMMPASASEPAATRDADWAPGKRGGLAKERAEQSHADNPTGLARAIQQSRGEAGFGCGRRNREFRQAHRRCRHCAGAETDHEQGPGKDNSVRAHTDPGEGERAETRHEVPTDKGRCRSVRPQYPRIPSSVCPGPARRSWAGTSVQRSADRHRAASGRRG